MALSDVALDLRPFRLRFVPHSFASCRRRWVPLVGAGWFAPHVALAGRRNFQLDHRRGVAYHCSLSVRVR